MPRTPPRNSTRNSTRTSREQPVARERRRCRRPRPAFGGGPTSKTLSYDAAGNLIDDGQDYEYVYDAWHRLVRIEVRSSADIVSEHRYPPYGWGNGFRAGERSDSNEDGRVNSLDKWYWFGYDERWRIVGTFRDSDSSPKERFLHHVAGMGGYGSSSYIDDLVLRDRDANTDWNDDASDGTLEERIYYCQNWRHDVVALVTSGGALRERVRYTAYGIPVGMPQGDCDGDGDVDAADQSILLGGWGTATAKCDLNLDGTVDAADNATLLGQLGATAGFGRLSLSGNRFGYAGYASDPAAHADWHVRHRVLMAELGRWSRRDPIGYVDGANLYQAMRSSPVSRHDPTGLITCSPPCSQFETCACDATTGLCNCIPAGQGGVPPFACSGTGCLWDGTFSAGGAAWLVTDFGVLGFGAGVDIDATGRDNTGCHYIYKGKSWGGISGGVGLGHITVSAQFSAKPAPCYPQPVGTGSAPNVAYMRAFGFGGLEYVGGSHVRWKFGTFDHASWHTSIAGLGAYVGGWGINPTSYSATFSGPLVPSAWLPGGGPGSPGPMGGG